MTDVTDRYLNPSNSSCRRAILTAVAIVVLAAMVGCEAKPTLVPVTGTVTLNGKPLGLGRIQFEPVSGTATSAVGDIDADGKFELFTLEPGDGVQPGVYYPVVLDPKEDEQAPESRRIGVVQLQKSHFEVTADEQNEFEVAISREDVRWAIKDD